MRTLFLLLFAMQLMALNIDPLVLKAQASIFPKVMLLDNDVAGKTIEKKLILSVVYGDAEHKSAQKFKELIDNEYANKLGDLALEVRLSEIKGFDGKEDATAYYIFDASSAKMKEVISHAEATHRICFGYNYKDFDKNVLVSLFVKEKTYIYLNKSALQEYHVKFTPIFYRIVKVVE